jgi:hypothetical protein
VASSLALTLLANEQSRLAAARPVNAEAYEAYLKGLAFQDNLTPSNMANALKYFELTRQRSGVRIGVCRNRRRLDRSASKLEMQRAARRSHG